MHLTTHFRIIATVGLICFTEFVRFMFGFSTFAVCINRIINQSIKQNILFVKIIQACTSAKSLSPEIIHIFKQNTHSVAIDDDEIDHELVRNIQQQYNIQEMTERPVHSGMVSVVYLGKIGEQKVVIKTKRRNIEERIREGSANINFIYECLYKLLSIKPELQDKLKTMSSITKTTPYLISQCDFESEINALVATREEMSAFPICEDIVIPRVYNKTTANAQYIIMEHLSGGFSDKITDDALRKQYLRMFVAFTLTQGWFTTYYHTDLHNGNIICMSSDTGPKLGVIDFGMNMKLTGEMKEKMQQTFKLICNIDKTTGEVSVTDFSRIKAKEYINLIVVDKIDVGKLSEQQQAHIDIAMQTVLSGLADGSLEEYHINQTFDVLKQQLGMDFVVNMEMVLLLISLSMGNSTLRLLANHNTDEIREHIQEVLKEFM
jgi:predicted unusual protein kinase regulating ubiquinone biosynthesis (AarF/ABC1/UbiB family)